LLRLLQFCHLLLTIEARRNRLGEHDMSSPANSGLISREERYKRYNVLAFVTAT
jgi:hypothetical protein